MVQVVAGQSPPSDAVTDYDGYGLPFLQGNAEFGLVSPQPKNRCDIARRRAVRGDILISIRAPVGALNIADREYGIGRGLAALRPRSNQLNERYLWWGICSLVPDLASLAVGSTYDAVTGEDIGTLPIPIWSLERQRSIAAYLDAETGRLDALISKRRQMIALLDERVKSVVNAPFGSQIVYGLDGRPLGLVGVACVRLGQVSAIQSGLTLDGGREAGLTAVTLPYLRVANVQDGSLDLSELKEVTVSRAVATRCRLEAGDVLMTEGGDPDKLGRGAVWPGDVSPCLHQNHIFAVRPGRKLSPEYLALITRTSYARTYFEMTASKTTGLLAQVRRRLRAFVYHCRPSPSSRVSFETLCID